MADIRNDQYLHRPGAGRGAITPADPFEVLLYDGSGNPLLAKKPTGETRQALGVAGYGYDGTNWRPVKVNASGQAEVQLTGHTVDMATETTLAQAVDKLNSILSRLEGKLDTAIFDSQGNPISAANRLPVEATLTGQLQIMDRIAGIVHELGPGETYKTERPLDASRIQSDIATIVVSGQANARRDIDVYVSMKPLYSHETEKMLVYSSLEDAVPQATHVFNIVLQYPEFYLHVTNRSSSTFTIQNISLVGRGVR